MIYRYLSSLHAPRLCQPVAAREDALAHVLYPPRVLAHSSLLVSIRLMASL